MNISKQRRRHPEAPGKGGIRPVWVNGDQVVIRWLFRFEWLDGSVTNMEELAYQRWEGERIAEETFFYDPAQRVPRRGRGIRGSIG